MPQRVLLVLSLAQSLLQQPATAAAAPLQPDPRKRPTAAQLMAMPFIADSSDWLSEEFQQAQVGAFVNDHAKGWGAHCAADSSQQGRSWLDCSVNALSMASWSHSMRSCAGAGEGGAGGAHSADEQAAAAAAARQQQRNAAGSAGACVFRSLVRDFGKYRVSHALGVLLGASVVGVDACMHTSTAAYKLLGKLSVPADTPVTVDLPQEGWGAPAPLHSTARPGQRRRLRGPPGSRDLCLIAGVAELHSGLRAPASGTAAAEKEAGEGGQNPSSSGRIPASIGCSCRARERRRAAGGAAATGAAALAGAERAAGPVARQGVWLQGGADAAGAAGAGGAQQHAIVGARAQRRRRRRAAQR